VEAIMKAHLLAVLAVGLLLGADAPNDDVKKEKEKLQGTWKAVTVEQNGESKEDAEDHRLIFAGDEFTIKRGDQAILKGKFKIDPSKNPKEIDMDITEAQKEQLKDKTAVGIYSLDGDTLKWCVTEPGCADRPKEFSGTAGSKQLMVTLKREKP
jgi:uncharacterized protein (TIGR03067 family)